MAKSPQFTLQLVRAIFQARYKPSLGFFSVVDNVASGLLDDYPDWERSPQGELRLLDYKNDCTLDIDHNAFMYVQTSEDLNLAPARIAQACEQLPGGLLVESFTRFGFRVFLLASVNLDFKSLVQLTCAKFYQMPDRLKDVTPERIDDLLYRIDASDESLKFHIHIAPVERHEINPKILKLHNAPTFKRDQAQIAKRIASFPEVSLLVDIDAYQMNESIRPNQIHSFYELAYNRTLQMANNYVQYVLG